MKCTTLSVAITTVVLSSAARVCAGDSTPGFYLNADAGGIFQQGTSFTENGFTENATFNPGIRTDLKLGYGSGPLAVEFEAGFMWNSMDTIDQHQLSNFAETLNLYQVPLLVNVIYRIPTGTAWTPYVGAGIGGDVCTFDGTKPSFSSSDTTAALAFQFETGVHYALSDHVSVGIAYKFFGTTEQDYSFNEAPHINDHVTLTGNYIHGVFATLTWNF